MVVLTAEKAKLLSLQASKIIKLIIDAQTELGRKDLIDYFRANPGEEELLEVAEATLKSFPLVLRGLKQKLGSLVLPDLGDSDHPKGWLEVGDVFVGWTGYLHTENVDRHAVVVADTTDGYEWRYIDEAEGTSHPPRRNDRYLQFAGWHKIEVGENPAEEIEAYQQEEIDALSEQIAYFQSNAFMQ